MTKKYIYQKDRICETQGCTQTFTSIRSRQYCDICRIERNRARARARHYSEKPPKICAHCGKEFTIYQKNNQKFCSKSCAGFRDKIRAETTKGKIRVCLTPDCGASFPETGRKNQPRYCKECKKKRKAAAQRVRYYTPKPPKNCELCGAEFTMYTREDQKYCSRRCGSKGWHMNREDKKEAAAPKNQAETWLDEEIAEHGGFVDAVITENFAGQPLRGSRPATHVPRVSSLANLE